jgi:hypothetical protein
MHAQSPIATAPSATTDGRIAELHLWAVREGLRRAPAATLFEEFCRRLACCRGAALARFRRDANATSAMGRLHLHLVARSGLGTPGEARAG